MKQDQTVAKLGNWQASDIHITTCSAGLPIDVDGLEA
jgi:hypothetical protein